MEKYIYMYLKINHMFRFLYHYVNCSLAQKPNKIKVIAIAYFSMPEHTKISNNFNLLGFCANLTCTGRETSACD